MQDYTGLEISPRKVAYLKYLSGQRGSAKISELSAHFGVDPSTATRTVQELKAEGFVYHEPYGDVVLTGFGEEYSAFLLRRHRIVGLILSHYGLSDKEACEEASRIECFISRGAVNKMCRALGHPTAGLCGEITHDALCRPVASAPVHHEKLADRQL
jgi:DtxR family Mn-dependent transcriptional regulator